MVSSSLNAPVDAGVPDDTRHLRRDDISTAPQVAGNASLGQEVGVRTGQVMQVLPQERRVERKRVVSGLLLERVSVPASHP